MNAVDLLQQQHHEAKELFERFKDSDDGRAELARKVIADLRVHMAIEEEIFYPEIRQRLGRDDDILESFEEHHVAEVLIDEIEGLEPADDRFEAKMSVLKELVEHHIEEEEDELFPEVRHEVLDRDLQEIGERMQARADELEAEADSDATTKDELYQRARELDIEGRSAMSKRELASALRATK